MSNENKIQVKMVHEKETKGTQRYAAAPGQEDPVVSTVYITKSKLPTPAPANITLTITVG